jgi:alkylation response protein AidB-like acyl-CoA dehydrogenase
MAPTVIQRVSWIQDCRGGRAMDIGWTAEEEAFRAEVRDWLGANKPPLPMPSGDSAAGVGAHLEWERTLFDAGWAVVSWPREYGGREASLWEWLIFEEAYFRAGLPQRVVATARLG